MGETSAGISLNGRSIVKPQEYECLLHDESSRMVYGAFSEKFMHETYRQMFAGDTGRDVALTECADEICRRLDSLLIGKLWK